MSGRFVALGDSVTVGLGDGVSMTRRKAAAHRMAGRGWAAQLAHCLGDGSWDEFVNLATTGATTADLRRHQLPVAEALRPTVASLVGGMNDVIKPSFDALAVRRNMVWSAGRLRARGTTVLMATLPDPARLLWLPPGPRQLISTRVAAVNAAVEAASRDDAGVVAVDLSRRPETYQLSSFDVDRVHPGPRGHQLLARIFAEALLNAGVPVRWLPDVDPEGEVPGRLAYARWMAFVGVPWMLSRMVVMANRARAGADDDRVARPGAGVMPGFTASPGASTRAPHREGIVAGTGVHSLP